MLREHHQLSLNKLQETVEARAAWLATVHGGCKESDATSQLNNDDKSIHVNTTQ